MSSILHNLPVHPVESANRLVRNAERFRYRLDLQYDGTEFSGMQYQPDRRTVQNCVEEALFPLFGQSVRLAPSSRTDAGVHADLQVCHFDAPVRRSAASIVRAGNSALPPDVRILSAEEKTVDFHARFSAKWRGYQYRISLEPVAIGRQYLWQFLQKLDVNLLSPLAEQVLGTHSFKAFAHENPLEKHGYECSVYKSKWYPRGSTLNYEIHASRFVHGMVRMLVGTMIDIACSRGGLTSIADVLASQDNRSAGTKAPACGLTLNAIGYSEWPAV